MLWETVIGLELHTRLKTQSKLFSGAANCYGAAPNVQACNIDVALPGVLPVLNKEAIRMAIAFGLAIGAEIPDASIFARKHYFYPDLPKGYQISQYEHPIVAKGSLEIMLEDGRTKHIGITRAHLEEDAGKSVHDVYEDMSGIDLNRAGTCLIEIVSEPELRSAFEAVAYMRKIHSIVSYLDICDGNMQEGSFRCDVNVSVKPQASEKLGTRTEIKNLNSFRYVEKAIEFETQRHIEILEDGGEIQQETRLFDVQTGETRNMRSKEEANDYRYFPDPDLLPIEIDATFVQAVRNALPELPDIRKKRLQSEYQLDEGIAEQLVADRAFVDYFEQCSAKTSATPHRVFNWMNSELMAALNKDVLAIEQAKVSATALAELLNYIEDGTISGKIAKQVFIQMWADKGDATAIIEQQNLHQISDSGELEAIIQELIDNHPKQVEQYRSGKDKVFGYFVGQVMKATCGKANPKQVNTLLQAKLK